MPRRAQGISAAKVAKARPGRYGDGGGLYLLVRSPEAKFWVFRFVRGGRMREMGLGPATGRTAVSLADARLKARKLYDMHRDGRDPLAQRAESVARGVTFADAADRYIKAHRAGWKNAKHAEQWSNTLATYALPLIGELPMQSIDTGLVLKVLEPIWTTKTETASRVRGRIEAILDWAKARGYRDGENPARWKGHLANTLPKRAKVRKVKHHAALPYAELGGFMAMLRDREDISARALEFTILTAARTGEVIGARWDEFDLKKRLWTVPGDRMKSGRDHRVPLSNRAIEILQLLKRQGPHVFPLSNMAMLTLLRRIGPGHLTVHGFRSSFRDWCAERTNYPHELAEMALAHIVSDKTEKAYRRGDMFEKRRQLMDAWAMFCAMAASTGEVLPLHG